MGFAFKPDTAARILWHVRPACGRVGCGIHPECVCSLCGKPIDDQEPVTIRGEGRSRAQFHEKCFESIVEFRRPKRDNVVPMSRPTTG